MAERGLDLTPEKMRELGYAAVDAVVEHLETLRSGPTFTAPPPDLAERILEPPPEDGADPVELLGWLRSEVLAAGVRNHHPGMFAFIPVSPTFPGVVADMLAAGMNVFAGSFQSGPGASVVELEVLGWCRDMLGLDPAADGVIASGGSTANLVGLAAARDRRPDGGAERVAYTTTEAHSSVGRALRLLGMERVTHIAMDERFRMRADALAEAMSADREAGRVPWCVIGAAGSTNTGAVDDLPALRRAADEHGAWLHVDGAYGGFLGLTERGRAAMPGLELADTLVLDAHKSLYCPLLAGIVFARDGKDLERTFAVRPEYLKDMDRYGGVNFADRGIELSRPFRALKVWLTVKTFGFGAIREALDNSLDLAIMAAELIEASTRLDLVTGPSLGVVNFRSSAGVPVERLMEDVIAAGAYISATTVAGERTARICALGHRSDEVALRAVIEAAEAAS